VKKLVAIALSLVAYMSHTVAQPIVSIGDLKIGMTEEEFLVLPIIKSKNIQDYSKKNFNASEYDVWKKTSESRNSTYRSRVYLPDNVEYEFKMATGVKDLLGKDAYDVTAKFYKGELIRIQMNLSLSLPDFKNILTEKYGNPTLDDNMKKVTCQNTYGAKSEHYDGYRSWDWGGESEVKASLFMSSISCGKFGSMYFIGNTKKYNFVLSAEKKAEEDERNEVIKAKASSSKL
jgi:hypothetical protein